MTEKKNKDGSAENSNIKVRLQMQPGRPSLTAQHLVVNDIGEFIQMSFFEIAFPVLDLGSAPESTKAIVESGVVADCVARINVPRGAFPGFAKAVATIAKQIDSK